MRTAGTRLYLQQQRPGAGEELAQLERGHRDRFGRDHPRENGRRARRRVIL